MKGSTRPLTGQAPIYINRYSINQPWKYAQHKIMSSQEGELRLWYFNLFIYVIIHIPSVNMQL